MSPLPFDPPVVLLLSRLVREKGIDVALHACVRVAEFPDLRVVLAGDGRAMRSSR